MHVCFLCVFTYREVVGLAEIAACLYKREPKYFLPLPFDVLSLISELSASAYRSPSYLFVGICLMFTWTHLRICSCIYLSFPIPNPSNEFLCCHCDTLLLSFCLFSFLDPVLPLPQLLTLNGSVYKLQNITCLEWALTQNFSCLPIATFY